MQAHFFKKRVDFYIACEIEWLKLINSAIWQHKHKTRQAIYL